MHSTQDDNTVSNPALLRVKQLSIHIETGHRLVKDLSFDVYPAQTVAIVGESGSGKSISALALLGLLPNNLTVQGQVEFAGRSEEHTSELQSQR